MKTCLRTSKGGKNTLLTRNTNQAMRRKWHIASFCSPPPALNSSSKKSWSVNMSMLHDFKELTKLCLLFSSKELCEQKPFSLIVGNQFDQVHHQSFHSSTLSAHYQQCQRTVATVHESSPLNPLKCLLAWESEHQTNTCQSIQVVLGKLFRKQNTLENKKNQWENKQNIRFYVVW